MKTDIHPTYHEKASISCACGSVFHTGSTIAVNSIEICSQCHPFYTGKKKFIDVAGRVERFKQMTERSQTKANALQPKKARLSKQADTTSKQKAAPVL